MKILIAILATGIATGAFAQTIITGQIKHAAPGVKVAVNVPFNNWLYSSNAVEVLPGNNGFFTLKANVQQAQFIVLMYDDLRIKLYAEPSKQLDLLFDANNYAGTLAFKGDLSAENNICSRTGLSFFSLYPQLNNDSSAGPVAILTGIKEAQANALHLLHSVTNIFTPSFKKIAEAEIMYYPVAKIFDLSFADGAWDTRPETLPRFTLSEWKRAIAAAYDSVPISNNDAINSYNYLTAVNNYPFFVQRRYDTKEELVPLVEKIMQMPFDSIKQRLRTKGKSYFDFKVLTYYLHGIALQKAMACFIDKEINQGELECIDEAYNYFTAHFAGGDYAAHVQQAVSQYLLAKAAAGSEAFTFITDTTLNLDNAIKAFKGKVLLIDLWGTWCPACREEMAYIPTLQEKYKNNPVAFIYVAVEHATSPEKNWKETVHFFNIQGTHVLANSKIQGYINNLYKNKLAYPAYILIDKNGNIVNANAAYPSTGNELYKQIDALL